MASEYVDTIDTIIDYLTNERDRRQNAIDSGEFCDNKTSERHIRIINKGLESMIEQQKVENAKKRIGSMISKGTLVRTDNYINVTGLTYDKKEILKECMGIASSEQIDFNKVRNMYKGGE